MIHFQIVSVDEFVDFEVGEIQLELIVFQNEHFLVSTVGVLEIDIVGSSWQFPVGPSSQRLLGHSETIASTNLTRFIQLIACLSLAVFLVPVDVHSQS